MTFDDYSANAQAIFDSFPNEDIWQLDGIMPNRQVEKPEAGYCIVFRYDAETTRVISDFIRKVHTILPPVVEYETGNLHTTIGVYGKGAMQEFAPDSATIKYLAKSVEQGLQNYPQNPGVELRKWLFNNEAILVSGYPNQDFWNLSQNIRQACNLNGYSLEMVRIAHITTVRFIHRVTRQVFEEFALLMKSAPTIGSVKPNAIDLATWQCDGLTFDLTMHQRFHL